MSKKNLALLIAVVMVLSIFAGCSTDSADETPPDNSPTGPATTQEPDGGKERGTVRVVFCEDLPTKDYVDNQFPPFMEESGITIESEILPAASFYEKMELGMAANTQDWDICQVDISCAGPLLAGGYLEPLDSYMENATPEWKKGYEGTNVLKSFEYKDAHYGIPQFMGTCIMMYNSDHFKDVGLDPDNPPKTFDELIEACKLLNRPDEGKNAIVFRASREGATCSFFWSMLLFNQGGSWYPKDHESLAIFDTEAAKKATEYFVELGKYAPEGILNYTYNDCYAAIQQGKASVLVDVSQCASWTIDPKLSTVTDAMRFSAFDGPCLGGNWNFSIGSKSEAKDLAWEVIEYMTGYDVSWAECKSLNLAAPCRTDILKNPELYDVYPESLVEAMLVSQADCNAIFYPVEPQCNEIVTALAININDALAGRITAEQAMSKTQQEVLEIKKRDGLE